MDEELVKMLEKEMDRKFKQGLLMLLYASCCFGSVAFFIWTFYEWYSVFH